MSTATATAANPYPLSPEAVATYRRNGYLHTPGVLNAEEVTRFREGFLTAASQTDDQAKHYAKGAFQQYVNLWRQEPKLLGLALHDRLRHIATTLAGVPLRLYHDQLLLKKAHNGAPSEIHQDQPYWCHAESDQPISAWVALVDVPVLRGCMGYIRGTHQLNKLPMTKLEIDRSLFSVAPELEWEPVEMVPVRAGDIVWHHGRTAHRAEANRTDLDRVAISIIYIPRTTRYTGERPVGVLADTGIGPGDLIQGERFPEI